MPRIARPLKSYRVLQSESAGVPPRQQYYTEGEMVGSNDVKLVTKVYVKRTDMEDSYDIATLIAIQVYRAATDSQPMKTVTYTSLVTGVKGQIEGDHRMDTITTTSSSSNGIWSDGPRQAKVLLKDPTAGMTDQERLEYVLRLKGRG